MFSVCMMLHLPADRT